MLIKASISRKSHSQKILKCLFLISSVSIFSVYPILPQSIRKEKINALIKELTPAHTIEKSFKNLEIIGYDVLDENRKHITSKKFIFFSGNQFYIVLYGKRKITEGKASVENKLERCKTALVHPKGGYFWSIKTAYLLGEQEIEDTWEEWQIGGIYKIRFAFKVPEFALPGKYILRINKENSDHPEECMFIIDTIKINIKRKKIQLKEITEDYNLSLEGCLLNPAIKGKGHIAFPWTGNIEFYLDRDIRNYKKIIVSAKGILALGYPLLKIYVDQIEIGAAWLNSEWNQYEFELKVDKESHILKVRFVNGSRKRNMYVKMVKLVR